LPINWLYRKYSEVFQLAAVTTQSTHDPQHRRSSRIPRLTASLLAALLLGALWPSVAHAIPRDATLARGMSWINVEVSYSQARYYGGYRTDCSGFVSMCWATRGSYNTKTLHDVAHPISVNELLPGDALLRAGYHVRLFAGWIDEAHTRYVAYEETSPGAVQTIKYIASDLADGYIPYRYNGIESSPSSWNLLANPTFDVWSGDSAVWWTASKDASGTVSRRTRAGARTPRFSLGVTNRSKDPAFMAEVRQSAAVEASRTYTLLAYAWTNREPRSVQMRLQFFDAGGRTLVDTSIAGDAAGVGSSGFTPMAITRATPSGATSATVTFRLAGGAYIATDTAGTALFDDVVFQVSSPMAVYRFYNASKGTHFYTASGPERDSVIRGLWSTYRYEGVAYSVGSSASNSQNLYRFYNVRTGTHFYTASEAERTNVATKLGATFRYEGVAYQVSPGPVAGGTAVYRFYNRRAGTHFYTASDAERNTVMATLGGTYTYEGTAFYVGQ
jgi:hypothetical protein